jgi:uncharacterized membrane protein
MSDIKDVRVLWLKFALFLLLGALASAIALVRFPDWRLAALMATAVWAFCRAYYFAFYVIERYADPEYKFAGLGSFVRYALRQRGDRPPQER